MSDTPTQKDAVSVFIRADRKADGSHVYDVVLTKPHTAFRLPAADYSSARALAELILIGINELSLMTGERRF